MKQFDRVTEDIKRGIAILTLFYGVDDSEMSLIPKIEKMQKF